MTFQLIEPKIPTSIGRITVHIYDANRMITEVGANGVVTTFPDRGATYDIEVLDQDGQRIILPYSDGDLVPHLTQAQIDALLQFMADMRTKAETEILGS